MVTTPFRYGGLSEIGYPVNPYGLFRHERPPPSLHTRTRIHIRIRVVVVWAGVEYVLRYWWESCSDISSLCLTAFSGDLEGHGDLPIDPVLCITVLPYP